MRWFAWVLLAGCAGARGFSDAGQPSDSGKDAQTLDAAEDAAEAQAQDGAPDTGPPDAGGSDSGVTADSGPAADSGQPADSGPADSGVQGKCFIPNGGGSFVCQVQPPVLFRVYDPDGGASSQCDQIGLVCPIGWACKLVSNGKTGTCIP